MISEEEAKNAISELEHLNRIGNVLGLAKHDAIDTALEYIKQLENDLYASNNLVSKYIEENKCLHCGNNVAGYCENCYQELVGENAKLQLENKNYKTLYINIQGVRTGKQLLKKYINDSILKSEIREKLEKAEMKIKHYKAARGSGKPIQTHIKLIGLITEVKIYKELLKEESK